MEDAAGPLPGFRHALPVTFTRGGPWRGFGGEDAVFLKWRDRLDGGDVYMDDDRRVMVESLGFRPLRGR